MAQANDFRCDGSQGHNAIHATGFDSFGGHAENDATGFVLGDVEGASFFHFEHSLGAIVAHARHDDADNISAAVASRRTEEHVYGGAVTADERTILDFDIVAGAAAF